jgi:hypothetical protein
LKKLADDLDQRGYQRKNVAAGTERLFNAKIFELEKVPKEVKNYLYIQMVIKMARLYYKILTTDTVAPEKQLKALLDEAKTSFEEIKKSLPKK